jgi:putative glutamine amidotransferase
VRVLLVHSDDRPFEVERFGTAWALAGGEASELVSVTPATASSALASRAAVSGILLTGGPDVEPWRYGEIAQAGVELHLRPERDALDLALLERAARERRPVLAICYGCQLLNVACGGTLIQDLECAGKPGHRVTDPKDFLTHEVRVDPAARFLPLAGERVPVNSRHHQGLARLGAGLVAAAIAPDGVIEAIEPAAGDRFVLGVQWHPENLAQEPHVAIFRAFRCACLGAAPA